MMVLLSRRAEFAADRYSIEHGYGVALRNALAGLFVKNAATLVPDPLYAQAHYTHPGLTERLATIEAEMTKLSGLSIKKIHDDETWEQVKNAYQQKFESDIIAAHGQDACDNQGVYERIEEEPEVDQTESGNQVNDDDYK
jgi:hypothetical protein